MTETSQFSKLSGMQRLLEAGLLFSCVFAMFVMLALFSFDPADPGWSQTGYQTPVRNLGGAVGAYFSDLLLNLFGLVAFSLPFMLAISGWLLFQKYRSIMQLDYLILGLKFIGRVMFYIGITSLASMNFDDVFYFSAGGILGDVLSNSFMPYLSFIGSTLLFLMFTCAGFVLLTGVSWLTIIDLIGQYTIIAFQYCIILPGIIKTKVTSNNSLSRNAKGIKSSVKPSKVPKVKGPLQSESMDDVYNDKLNKQSETLEVSDLDDLDDFDISEEYYNMDEDDDSTVPLPDFVRNNLAKDIVIDDLSNSSVKDKEDINHFVAIDDLMSGPLEFNVQEKVNEEEISAAFKDVDKIAVPNAAPNQITNDLIASQEDRYQGLPALDLLDRPDKAENPIEQEGTYPLPEAQVDRFMLKTVIDYPKIEEEQLIVRSNLNNTQQKVNPVVTTKQIQAAQTTVREIYMDEKIEKYILDLVFATRYPENYSLVKIKPLISFGASPRGSINLATAAKCHAFLKHRGYVIPEDVRAIIYDVLRHRIGLTYEAEAENITTEDLISQIINEVEVP